MKTKIFAAIALLSTSFTPISMMTMPAQAVPAPASDANAPDEAAICNSLYVDNQATPADWRSTVTNASSTPTTPAPIAGTELPVNYHANTGSTWSYVGFLGTSGSFSRNGGSPNLWAWATYDHSEWDNTLYDVQMNFSHDMSYSWTCHVEQYVDHPEFVPDPPAPPPGNGGTCENNGNGNGNNNNNNQQNNGNGGGNNGCGNGNGGSDTTSTNTTGNGNGGDNGCGAGGEGTNDDVYAGNSDHVCKDGQPGTVVHHYTWDFAADYSQSQTNTGIDDGTDITQTDVPQAGHVGTVDYLKSTGPLTTNVRILSCISPGSKGGAWKPKDYYHGTVACSTAAFNAAPTLSGRTFDSPPTNSLPAY